MDNDMNEINFLIRPVTLADAAVITIPNEASIGLHEKLGFRKTGTLREIGFKDEAWLDVGYWQLLL
jgi:phosphinothricin acetyltransferase